MTPHRTIDGVLSDLRKTLCSLLEWPASFVREGNKNIPVPIDGAPFAALILVSCTQTRSVTATGDRDDQSVDVTTSAIYSIVLNLHIYREQAHANAIKLEHILGTDYGAQCMRSIAVGITRARQFSVADQIISTQWEPHAVVVLECTAMIAYDSTQPAFDPSSFDVTLGDL